MIIFSSAFALAETSANRPLTHARIGYQTWTEDLEPSSVAVSSEAENAPGDAVLRPDTGEYWEPTALPATLVIDLGAARDVDYVGLAAHTLGSEGCTVTVETSTGALAGSPSEQVWTEFADSIAPGDDRAILFLDSSRTARYLRLTITGSGDMPKLAVVYVGEILAMPRSIYGGHGPITLSRETVLHRSLSRGGQILGQGFRRHGLVGSASWRHLEPNWYREHFDPFVESARNRPFFFAWRPGDYSDEVAYGVCPDDIHPTNMGVREFMQVGFSMHAVGCG